MKATIRVGGVAIGKEKFVKVITVSLPLVTGWSEKVSMPEVRRLVQEYIVKERGQTFLESLCDVWCQVTVKDKATKVVRLGAWAEAAPADWVVLEKIVRQDGPDGWAALEKVK